jgi:hypothetical protein
MASAQIEILQIIFYLHLHQIVYSNFDVIAIWMLIMPH